MVLRSEDEEASDPESNALKSSWRKVEEALSQLRRLRMDSTMSGCPARSFTAHSPSAHFQRYNLNE